MRWVRRHPIVSAAVIAAAASLAFWVWRQHKRSEADWIEIVSLESTAKMACDNLSFDLGNVANGLENGAALGDDSVRAMYGLAPDRTLLSPGRDVANWYTAFSACGLARDWSNRESDDAHKEFFDRLEKVRSQNGAELATTLRDLEARVKKVRAMQFRRTRP